MDAILEIPAAKARKIHHITIDSSIQAAIEAPLGEELKTTAPVTMSGQRQSGLVDQQCGPGCLLTPVSTCRTAIVFC
jgi:hypothetical protein